VCHHNLLALYAAAQRDYSSCVREYSSADRDLSNEQEITRKLMLKVGLLAAAALISAALLSAAAAGNSARVPVLLELFTSEGCTSCPPADRLLEVLDQEQPIAGADLIVLSEHVDYWNHLGWRDPYSSAQYSARQEQYNRSGSDGVYTPQLVVDGRFRFVGSDERETVSAVQKAIREPKVPITISNVARDGQEVRAHIELPAADPSFRNTRGVLYFAIADNRAESHVARGENAGRSLAHVAVTRVLKQVGTISLNAAAAKDIVLTLQPGTGVGGSRIVAFIQDPTSGHILGVAARRL
jgi:hypothetical protein